MPYKNLLIVIVAGGLSFFDIQRFYLHHVVLELSWLLNRLLTDWCL